MVKFIKSILKTIAVLSFIMMIGVIGGVENGGSLINILWTIPLFALSAISGYLGIL